MSKDVDVIFGEYISPYDQVLRDQILKAMAANPPNKIRSHAFSVQPMKTQYYNLGCNDPKCVNSAEDLLADPDRCGSEKCPKVVAEKLRKKYYDNILKEIGDYELFE